MLFRSKLGNTVVSGDVNGDNYDDIIIGAMNGDGPSGSKTQAGEVFVIFGNTQGALGVEIDLLTDFNFAAFMGPDKYDKLGSSLAGGDLDRLGWRFLHRIRWKGPAGQDRQRTGEALGSTGILHWTDLGNLLAVGGADPVGRALGLAT